MYFLSPIITVCPALHPPWYLIITLYLSESVSMIFPLPSSPHCAPITIVFGILFFYNFPSMSINGYCREIELSLDTRETSSGGTLTHDGSIKYSLKLSDKFPDILAMWNY